MSYTSSQSRKEGSEAFSPNCDPMDFQPFKKHSWNYTYFLEDWLEGWKEAEANYEFEKNKIDNCPYEVIKNKIAYLSADPELIDILYDILNLIKD